jgi:hypothetical protein
LSKDNLLLDEKIATSSTPSNPLAYRRTISLPEAKSADRCRSGEGHAAAPLSAGADKGFPRLAASLA